MSHLDKLNFKYSSRKFATGKKESMANVLATMSEFYVLKFSKNVT